MAELNEQQKQMAKIVAKAWADDEYKQRFISDPAAVLREEGVELPDGMNFKVLEAKENENWIVLPPKPADEYSAEMSEERLAAVACMMCVGLCKFCN
jgi:hypothetical protein